jgi:cytidylate kinase
MVELQRKLASNYDIITEGRDTTTVVFPSADIKIYLDASLEERVKRRFIENQEKNIDMSYEEIKENIIKRDYNDTHKEVGSLIKTDEQIYIDTTNLNIDEVVNKIENIIKER